MSDLVGNPEDGFSHYEAQMFFPLHYRCAIDIVRKYFPDYALKKQDILGAEERCSKVLQLVPDESILFI